MKNTTVFIGLLVAVTLVPPCPAQQEPADFAKAFIPEPGEFLPKAFRETEEDRQRLARVELRPREEQRFGQQMAEWYLKWLERQGVEVLQRGRDVEYLRRLMNDLRPLMTNAKRYRRIRIVLAESGAIDARSFPGGTIVLHRGMLEFTQSEAAVVAVLAHELSHIDRGHQLDSLRRQKLAQQTLAGGPASWEQFLSAGKMFTLQFLKPFHPEQEAEADRDAVRWMAEVGYDPMELANFFLRMHERNPNRNRFIPSFLQSHPFDIDRFEAARKATERIKVEKRAALYVGKENLKQRITMRQHEFPE